MRAAVRGAAKRAGTIVSKWLSSAAESRLRNDLLRDALDQWQAEDGAITEEELDEAARKLGVTRSKHGSTA